MKRIMVISCITASLLIGAPQGGLRAEASANLYVVDASVTSFIETLGNVSGQRIDVTDGVRGRIQRQRFEGPLADVLDILAQGRDLEWFHFNNVYYVSQSQEATSRVVRLGNITPDTATDAIDGAGLVTAALSQTTTPNGEAIVLTGPPKLVAFAEIIIESIPDVRPVVQPEKQIRVRRGTSLAIVPTIAAEQEFTQAE